MAALIPLTDASRRPTSVPLVTGSIIAVNIVVFLLELTNGDTFVSRWSLTPAEAVAGHRWVTLLTSMFMHGSWSHIIGNMVFFWAFGPEVEDSMGPGRYLAFYLLGGAVAAVTQIAAMPTATTPILGASGAIAAVMGAFIVTYPRDRIRSILLIFVFLRITYIPAALLIGVWFLIQFVNLGAVTPTQGGVAYAAHVGGFIFGAVAARLFEERA